MLRFPSLIAGSAPVRSLRVAALVLLMLAAVAPAASAVAANVWTAGHGDIGVAYDSKDPTAFEMEVHIGEGTSTGTVDGQAINDTAYAPNAITAQVPAAANLQRINNPTGFWLGGVGDGSTFFGYDFTTSQYNALGVVGSNL
ncbi:MAG: hypothetical protein O2946_10625, partial [Planctomycetota bacterium]|nr:hypothetical protein [Planctomycetota bacterium]